MKYLKHFLIICLIVEGLGACSQQTQAGQEGQPPNIILILTDDQGWSQSAVAMDPRVPDSKSDYLETPALARFAKQGMVFSSGYSPAPLCTPTRRSILCGTSAARSGEEFASTWVPADHPTIPTVLKQANPAYRAAHFGKWGGKDMINTPEECGYDASSGVTGNPDGDLRVAGDPSSGIMGRVGTADYFTNDDPKATGLVTRKAMDFMETETRNGNPFYLQVSYYAVHLNVVAHEETIEKYNRKGKPDRGYSPAWAAMLDELDAGIDKLLRAVDSLGIADNTYIIFTSDNGGRGTVPGGSGPAPNLPLDGAKHSLFEGGIRVPFIVKGPGIESGSVCHVPVVGYDLLPTFYAMAGGTEPLSKEIDGGNIMPLFKDPVNGSVDRPTDGLIFSRPQNGYSAIRQGDYKLMIFWDEKGEFASRTLHRFDPSPMEEGRDIASSNPEKADELQNILISYLKSVDAKTIAVKKKKKKG